LKDILRAKESDDSDEEDFKKNDVLKHIKRKKMRELKKMRKKYERMLKKINITPVLPILLSIDQFGQDVVQRPHVFILGE